MTKNAETILKIINESDSHPTAEEIYMSMKEKYGKVVLATVYNNLNYLCEAGYIQKIVMDNAPDRYDKPARHDHLICIRCGRLADFFMDDLTKVLEARLGSRIYSYDLKCSYLCPACRELDSAARPDKAGED